MSTLKNQQLQNLYANIFQITTPRQVLIVMLHNTLVNHFKDGSYIWQNLCLSSCNSQGKPYFWSTPSSPSTFSAARTIQLILLGLSLEHRETEKAAMQGETSCQTRERTRHKAHFYFKNELSTICEPSHHRKSLTNSVSKLDCRELSLTT